MQTKCVVKVFQSIFLTRMSKFLQSDAGTKYRTWIFQKFLKQQDLFLILSPQTATEKKYPVEYHSLANVLDGVLVEFNISVTENTICIYYEL